MSETFIALSSDRLLVKVENNNYRQDLKFYEHIQHELILRLIWALEAMIIS